MICYLEIFRLQMLTFRAIQEGMLPSRYTIVEVLIYAHI